jgi:chemotaxis protein MotA
VKLDPLSFGGLIVAVASVLGGQVLEGGHVSSVVQPTAALIVLGGTLGACLLAFPMADWKACLKACKTVFFSHAHDPEHIIERMTDLAKRARKDGLISLEPEVEKETDPFLKLGLGLAVDGADPKVVRETLEAVLQYDEERGHRAAKVLESAGGFCPTVGILGAVLGLIHVMENLSDPSKLGGGIATAFVATIYGVAAANIVFLPMANKMKLRHREENVAMEMSLVGVMAIQAGDNVRLIEEKLRAAMPPSVKKKAATPEKVAA